MIKSIYQRVRCNTIPPFFSLCPRAEVRLNGYTSLVVLTDVLLPHLPSNLRMLALQSVVYSVLLLFFLFFAPEKGRWMDFGAQALSMTSGLRNGGLG